MPVLQPPPLATAMSGFLGKELKPVVVSFDRLPQDIACIIMEALEEPPTVQRHSLDMIGNSKRTIVSFGSVSRRLRDWSQPYLFGHIAFGQHWENIGDLRWKVAETRMEHMLETQKLRTFVKSATLAHY
jgi:hypothetical protein